MRAWRLFSLLLLVPLLLSISCSGNDKGTDTGTDEAVLKGRVVDSSGEGGLAGATVRIEGTDMVAVTDEDGSFEFPGMAGGDFTVVIEPPNDAPYQSNRVGVSVHEGETVTVDLTVLPDSASVGEIEMFPASARVGLLESVQFFIGWPGAWDGEGDDGEADGGGGSVTFPYRPTWTIVSDHPIGVISREGIFIGTATGSGTVIATFSEELSATADIEVVADDEVARLVVRPGYWVHVPAGESRYLAAYAINGAGELAAGVPFVWGVDPPALGTIETMTTLTPEEVRAIYESLTWGDGWGPAGGTEPGGANGPNGDDHGPKEFAIGVAGDSSGPSDPSGGGDEPVPGPDPWEIDPAAIQIVRFTAATDVSDRAEGWITVKVDGADWGETVGLTVVERGELTTAWLYPEDVTVLPESEATFIAYGVNEWDRVLGGLEFEWSVEPASLGSIEAVEVPWMEPGGNGEPGGPDESGGPGFGWSAHVDSASPPIPPDDRPFPDWNGAARFRAEAVGEGEVVVVVRDPIANVTIERRAVIRVAEAAALAGLEIRPNPIEAYIGDSTSVEAVARNTWGDIEWSALVKIEFEGDAGIFVPFDGPRIAEYDSIPPHGDPGEPPVPPTDPNDPPEPGSGYGVAFGVFFANNPGGTGVMRATAIGPDGASFVVEAPVRAIGAIGKR